MAAGALSLAAVGIATANIDRPVAENEIPSVLLERLNPGTVLEQYLASTIGMLRSSDREGDGLDRGDVTLMRARAVAQARAIAVSEVLAYDLNGDFKVTGGEVAQLAQGEEPYRHQHSEATFERFDDNSDGVITLIEAADAAREAAGDMQVEALLALDPDGEGRLMAAELRTIAERAFARVDRDSDGEISPEEYKAIEARTQEARLLRSALRCDLPQVPARAKLVVYGGYESDAISSVSVGGPEQETNFIDVSIEPGATPLYLVLTSYESMVWRVSGATDRVAQAVVASLNTGRAAPITLRDKARRGPPTTASRVGVSASGVIGIPRDRVTIASSGCPPYFSNTKGGEAKLALATLHRALGRDPDAVFGSYSARRVSLPSGAIHKSDRDSASVPRGFDAASWPDAMRFWPGGLVTVDPKQVIAMARVEPYKVLPSQMGLSQLIGSGHVERTASGAFRIVKPIAHMPPSMGGAHSVKLIVAKGVPVPPGSPGHSCVILEETGAATDDGRTVQCPSKDARPEGTEE